MELENLIDRDNYGKLRKINNTALHKFFARYIDVCKPARVFVSSGSPEDLEYIREKALSKGEEDTLSISGHTIHFDNYNDQARDKKNTKILVPEDVRLGAGINTLAREKGLEEVHSFLKNIMKGK